MTKPRIGYYAQTEAFSPDELAAFCKLAEDSHFDEIWAADHFHPWVETDAGSYFAWIFLAQ
jgi:secondary-alcohol dehydrogenase (coenzyme-F420)